MTKGLLGNFAAFNTVVQLSVPNSHLTEVMSPAFKPTAQYSGRMSNLVAGSTAEQGSFDYLRYEIR